MDGCQSQVPTAQRCLSLVIPAYNEEAGIRFAIEEADRALAELADDYEILVVDDGSGDRTAEVVDGLARALPRVRLVRHARNRGYGAALRTGFQAAGFDRIAFTDADCQFYLTDLADLVSLTEEAPIAVGYRVGRQDPWPRRFFSWGYNLLVRTLLGTRVRDCDCALKVFRREALLELLPQTDGFFVNTEMLARARQLGYQVAEAPVRHRPRLAGESKVSLWDIPRTLRTLLPFWWSRVLFPAECEARSAERGAQSAEAIGIPSALRAPRSALCAPRFLLLLVVAALLFFSRLDCPLQEPEEPRYAEIPREMLRTDNTVLPILHGLPYYDKPPLLYWLVMGSYRAFGIHDWAARLVPSTAAFLTVLVTYFWGSCVAGGRAGFAAAMILTLSARFVYLGRLLTMNSLLCLWVVTALAAAHAALRGPALRWRWWLLSAGACGLGLLTKGPVALALVAAPVLVYRLLDTRTARLHVRSWIAYLGTALLLAGPWYLLVAGNDPDFIRYFFWKHNIVRFLAPFDHEKPIYAYLPDLLLGMFPWSLLLLPLTRSLCRHATPASPARPAAIGFFLITFIWCLGFYSVAGSKRSGYILPAMPPLALALGCHLDNRCGCRRKPAVAWGVCGAGTFAVLLLSLYLLAPGYAQKFSLRAEVQPYAEPCRNLEVPVVCYPRCWDSVSFYLGRDDVRVYTREQRRQLIADLRANPRTLAFVKCDHSLDELLRALPISLEFVPCGRQANVAVGWVRQRLDSPRAFFARR
jgi:4-amino-4-deoxy-L-arabinose transferase-like glycosyltransferase